ncbi:protein phosphatase CheZ [Methylobacterium platani]|uniref:Chemotaxis protein CheZ n=3 Tax=Methylobacterium platani TaxID=427683 RepID=A0A179S525_9HYPH|nr:protein phosphatase CheZ [Methylobacterium platani]KMO19016.1 chemotaxis protein CheZ [Methylobacterium platani JCM 14648]OAS22037.1 chemotaxis protein CheZ [Methylobacterium platani]
MTGNSAISPSVEEHAALLQRHLVSISDAIARTRHELAELRQEQEIGRACDELNAVVQGTEQATNTILTAAETVDALAGGIARRTRDDAARQDALAIQAQMQSVVEACNFQDLTGQRISKVVRTIGFVEERVGEMLRLWAGPQTPAARADRRTGEDALLNGPALPGEASVSQDAVDAMFP